MDQICTMCKKMPCTCREEYLCAIGGHNLYQPVEGCSVNRLDAKESLLETVKALEKRRNEKWKSSF